MNANRWLNLFIRLGFRLVNLHTVLGTLRLI